MSSRRLMSATCPVPPAAETTGKPGASPRLYRALRCDPQDNATRILLETETLLRIYGHRKIRVADVADACGFSAANVYRYFSSRDAILDALASHYLREADSTALACAACSSHSARDRLNGFLTGLNTALTIFSDSEPRPPQGGSSASWRTWPQLLGTRRGKEVGHANRRGLRPRPLPTSRLLSKPLGCAGRRPRNSGRPEHF